MATKTSIHTFDARTSVFAEFQVKKIAFDDIDQTHAVLKEMNDYTTFWSVKRANDSAEFIVGKGYNKKGGKPGAKGEHVMWYPNGKMYFGCERSLKDIIDVGMTNAFRYI